METEDTAHRLIELYPAGRFNKTQEERCDAGFRWTEN